MCKFDYFARNPKTRKLQRVKEIWTLGDCGFERGESFSFRCPKFGRAFFRRVA
jgi:hypothetical protein